MDKEVDGIGGGESLDALRKIAAQFVDERGWERFHQPKNLAMSIAIEAAELMEHFQWREVSDKPAKTSIDSPIAEELADVLAYVLCMANALDLDLTGAFYRKMEKNRSKYPVDARFEPRSF